MEFDVSKRDDNLKFSKFIDLFQTYRLELYFVGLPLSILVLLQLLGFDGMVGQDSYAYVDYSRSIGQFFSTDVHPGDFHWGRGYPVLGALLGSIGIGEALALQLISCISFSATLIFIANILRKINRDVKRRDVMIFLTLFGVFAPYFLRNAMLTMSDILATFLCTAAIYFTMRYREIRSIGYLSYATAAIVVACFVRYPSAVVCLPFIFYLIYLWTKSTARLNQLLVLLIPLLVASLHFFFDPDFFTFLDQKSLDDWHIKNYLATSFDSRYGSIQYRVPNVVAVFAPFMHYGFILFGILFLLLNYPSNQFRSLAACLCISSYVIYAFFLAGFDSQNPRHLILVYPMVLILVFPGFSRVSHFLARQKLIPWVAGGLLLAQITLSILSFKTIYKRNRLEQNIARVLKDLKTDAEVLYGFDIDVAISSRGLKIPIRNLWVKEYDYFDEGALVLFNVTNLSDQWAGKTPMINWHNLKENHQLVEIIAFEDNWKLFRID